MASKTVLPSYTKVDTNGKEIIYWNALGSCGHITLFEIPAARGDFMLCRRCNDYRETKVAKYMRPTDFLEKFGGSLVA
jgi:hypothetical protein